MFIQDDGQFVGVFSAERRTNEATLIRTTLPILLETFIEGRRIFEVELPPWANLLHV